MLAKTVRDGRFVRRDYFRNDQIGKEHPARFKRVERVEISAARHGRFRSGTDLKTLRKAQPRFVKAHSAVGKPKVVRIWAPRSQWPETSRLSTMRRRRVRRRHPVGSTVLVHFPAS